MLLFGDKFLTITLFILYNLFRIGDGVYTWNEKNGRYHGVSIAKYENALM